MRRLTVTMLESVNGIRFGTAREIVRNTFGQFKEFRKSPFSKNTTDNFGDFHIFYDINNCFEAIEIFDAEVVVDNVRIFPGTKTEVCKLLPEMISDEPDYWLSKEKSVGIYAPNGNIESILFGVKDYYK